MTSEPGSTPPPLGRRTFIRRAAGAATLACVSGGTSAAPAESPVTPSVASADNSYLFLGPDEATFVEALVDVMCPADELTPRGTECGLAVFIDRLLAGGFGQGERLYLRGPWRPGAPEDGWQLPLTPAQFFRAGLAAAEAACVHMRGKPFSGLTTTEADTFLTSLADGAVNDSRVPLATWFNELVYPLFVQACYADPIYGGNRGKVFWKMVGYPGLPAVHGLNMVKYRGRPFPGASDPKSMADFG